MQIFFMISTSRSINKKQVNASEFSPSGEKCMEREAGVVRPCLPGPGRMRQPYERVTSNQDRCQRPRPTGRTSRTTSLAYRHGHNVVNIMRRDL